MATEPELYYEPLTDKYRPKTLDAVFGQDTAKKILKGMLTTKKIARAYLLTGPHSTGKTTLARILARNMNCEKGPAKSCGKCPSCNAMDKKVHPDVTEIDAASNRGINEARELKAQASLAPRYKKRVFIIDEVHGLTGHAEEALLKTLEEPPPSTVFILCTTDPGKVRATIRSRLKWLKLSPLNIKDCGNLVQMVSAGEGFPLDETNSQLVAKYAYGHPREALHLVENIIDFAASGENVEDLNQVLDRIVSRALQMSPEMLSEKYVENVLQGLSDQVYKYVAEVDNAPAFLERVCYILRQSLILSTGGFKSADEYFDRFFSRGWVRNFGPAQTLKIYNIHLDALLKASTYTMDPVEILMKAAIESLLIIMECPPTAK